MAPLWLLYVIALLCIFKITNWKCEHLENGDSLKKCSRMTFIKGDIWNRMGPFRVLYSMTLTEIFKVIFFNWLFWQADAGKCNMLLASFRKSGILHRMAPLRSSYFATIFNSTNVELWICLKRWELAKNSQERILLAFIFAIALGDYEYWTPWSFPKFSRSNVLLIWICYKKNSSQRMSAVDLLRLKQAPPSLELPSFHPSPTTFILKMKLLAFYLVCEYFVNSGIKSKHYNCYCIDNHVFAIECCHCECYTSCPLPTFLW